MAKIAMTSDKKIMVLNEGVEGIPSITVDSELSNTSTNPVQNKVVKAAIDAVDTKVENKQNKIGVSGLLKSDGTTISAAVPGTDYAVPSTEPVVTPHIGDNGNWFIGETDTGKPSRGAQGPKGETGATGATGPQGPAGPAGVTIYNAWCSFVDQGSLFSISDLGITAKQFHSLLYAGNNIRICVEDPEYSYHVFIHWDYSDGRSAQGHYFYNKVCYLVEADATSISMTKTPM